MWASKFHTFFSFLFRASAYKKIHYLHLQGFMRKSDGVKEKASGRALSRMVNQFYF
ncbi:hypothetical protein NEOC65_001583 [Neochlamydia sp. AcF65]|nr:hypothetical protein [Neochlamydia sp. AcF65]NGY95904.1 hypothetical protein [Neochlamydia sp. AcF84]